MIDKQKRLFLFGLALGSCAIAAVYLYTKSKVEIGHEQYSCYLNGCAYQVQLVNKTKELQNAYLRINAFGVSGVAKMSAVGVVSTKRIELEVNPDEPSEVSGFIYSDVKPTYLQFGTGLVDEKI